jgi:hypothetical protein
MPAAVRAPPAAVRPTHPLPLAENLPSLDRAYVEPSRADTVRLSTAALW